MCEHVFDCLFLLYILRLDSEEKEVLYFDKCNFIGSAIIVTYSSSLKRSCILAVLILVGSSFLLYVDCIRQSAIWIINFITLMWLV